MKKVIAISGSTRAHSTNESILRLIADLHKDELDILIYKGISELPHFNPDLGNEKDVPESIKNFREMIEEADGVIICTPEYVFSLPGTLKNAIEWLVSTTVFSDKPTALIIASGLGEKAYESLILIMNTLQAKINDHSTLLIKGARSKFNAEGQIIDKGALQEIRTLTGSLLESMNGLY